VEKVQSVDEQLLVGRSDVAPRGPREDVLADRVAGVVRQIEHVDRFVGRLKIALTVGKLGERLLNAGPIEHEERVVPDDVARKARVVLDLDFLVDGFVSLARAARVERGAHLERAHLVAAASRKKADRRRNGESDGPKAAYCAVQHRKNPARGVDY